MTLLKIIAIYPAFDVKLNEMAMVWRELCSTAKVHCTVVTGARDRLKGHSSEELTENLPNMEVHRVVAPPGSSMIKNRIEELARKYSHDVIFCAVDHNLPLARSIQKITGAPIILHTEYFLDETMLLRKRAHLGITWLRPWAHRRYRKKLLAESSIILCSNPIEFAGRAENPQAKLQYLPWPHPEQAEASPRSRRDSQFTVYIGSFSRAKGADTLKEYYCALLERMPEFRVLLIGPAIDECGIRAMEAIANAGGSRVEIRNNCSRTEAIHHIGTALFVLSPGTRLGWGMIGDAWNCGTPVIALAEHYDLRSAENCLLAPDKNWFVEQVLRLQQDENLWIQLANAGRETVAEKHGVKVAAEKLYETLVATARKS